MDNLLLHFFLPTVDGSIHAFLQLSFAAIFLASVLLTIVLVRRQARPEHWVHRLGGSDETDARGPTHVTIDELAAAVATPAERWADILPSLLLVFGLLGTFIGLGLALTEAAGVLGPGNDALSGLTPIMDSLGSKFKTSTWGILAFLLLKVWFMLEPYEESRFAWAAREIRRHAFQEQLRQQQERADERQQLIDAVERSGASRHTEALVQAAHKQHNISEIHSKRLAQLVVSLDAMRKQQASLIQHGETQLLRLSEMAQDSAANRVAMDIFVGGVSENMEKMKEAGLKMSKAANATGTASEKLGKVIEDFRGTLVNVLGEVKTELGTTMQGMSATFTENMHEMSTGLTDATSGIKDAIATLSTGVVGTIKTLEKASQESVARQTIAHAAFAASSEGLTESIGKIETFIDQLGTKLQVGLTSVASSNQQMKKFEKQFTDSNDHVKAMVAEIKTLAAGIVDTSVGLRATETLSVDVAKLLAGIADQQQAQALAERQQQRVREESAQLNDRIDSLTASIGELVDAQKVDIGQDDRQRVADTLGRIEVSLGNIAQGRGRMQRATDPLAA